MHGVSSQIAWLDSVTVVTVDATATGKTLTALGVTISDKLCRLALVPHSDVDAGSIFWALGSASISSSQLSVAGRDIPISPAKAKLLKLYGSGKVDVEQYVS
jgi:hypothetical protein